MSSKRPANRQELEPTGAQGLLPRLPIRKSLLLQLKIVTWAAYDHEDCNPVWRFKGVRNTVAIETAPDPAILQLVQRLGFTGR